MLDRLKTLQAAGRLDGARSTFARIAGDRPGHLHAWLGLGYCASLAGETAAARDAVETAAALGVQTEDAAIDCAQAWHHLGEADRARAILAQSPTTARTVIARGEIEERQGEVEAAVACYEAALALDPDAPQALRRLIDLHRRWGAFPAALAAAERLARLDPRHEATAQHQRGLTFRAASDGAAALAAFRQAAERAPEIDAHALDLARAWQAAGRHEAAHAALAERAPSCAVSTELGEMALARRDHVAALRYFAEAHALEPKRPDPLARAARAEADRGEIAAALGFADRIEALGPEHRLAALRSRLQVHKSVGAEDEARRILEVMLALAPTDAGLLAEYGRQCRVTGEEARARIAVQTAQGLDPRHVVALTEAMEQALAVEDREGALGLCRRILAIAPGNQWHHLRLARLLHDLDRADEGAAVLAQVEARFGRSAEVLGERIRLLRESGDLYAALREARLAQAAFQTNFGRWSERYDLELRLSPVEEAKACLGLAPVKNRDEEAGVLFARSRLAQRRCDVEGAIALLDAALRLRSDHRGALWALFELRLRWGDVDAAADLLARVTALERPDRRFRKLSLNSSQSLQGQLLNEFRLDRQATAELAAARSGASAGAEVAALLSLVRKRPAHLASAFALLAALRRHGQLAPRNGHDEAADNRRVIPRVIGQFWDKAELSPELLRLGASWRQQNPDHRYLLFNADTGRNYLEAHFPPPVALAFGRCADPTTQADFFRIAFLVRTGGIWADMDDRCLSPTDRFIPSGAEACFWEEGLGSIGNNFMAAVPGHAILRRALVMAVHAIHRGDRDTVWMLTGPGLITRAFAADIAAAGEDWPSWLERIAVPSQFELSPFIAVHCRTAHKRLGKDWQKMTFGRQDPRRRAGAVSREAASAEPAAADLLEHA